ncbi:MAG: endonuclease/exonuclease/phosphatase family protein [Planctomycetota bacterium]
MSQEGSTGSRSTLIAAGLCLLAFAAMGLTWTQMAGDQTSPAATQRTVATTTQAAVAAASVAQPDDASSEYTPHEWTDEEIAALRVHGLAEPKPRTPATIRVATYNVENLFDDQDDPTLSGRSEDIDDEKPLAELEALAETIRRVDADILALQEIESERALRWFMEAHLQGMGYDHIASPDAGDGRGIEQAVISRFPITGTKQWVKEPLGGVHPAKYGNRENWYAGEPITMHRSPLMVDLSVPATAWGGQTTDASYELTVIVVHHKSGRHSGYWREKEATGLLERIADLPADQNVLIMGDFNARSSEATIATYLSAGFTDLFGDADNADPQVQTHAGIGRIDYVLFNEAAAAEVLPASRFVLGTNAYADWQDWRYDPAPPGYASDHYPVVVDLNPAAEQR